MEQHDDNALIIYTDGSCLQRPRRGGYAFRLITVDEDGEEVCYDYNPAGYRNATIGEMELMACVEALKLISGRRSPVPKGSYAKVVLYTDSLYVHDHVYLAEAVWPRESWLTRVGEPVLNQDLWKALVRHKQRAGRVEIRKVKAHRKNPHNKAVDRLAKDSAKAAHRELSSPPLVRRKTSPRATEPRSVRMRGQTETIRIVSRRSVRGQPKLTYYKYEVVASDSPDFERVDDAFARDEIGIMRSHHVYEVRFAAVGKARWIEEVTREVESPSGGDP